MPSWSSADAFRLQERLAGAIIISCRGINHIKPFTTEITEDTENREGTEREQRGNREGTEREQRGNREGTEREQRGNREGTEKEQRRNRENIAHLELIKSGFDSASCRFTVIPAQAGIQSKIDNDSMVSAHISFCFFIS
jgi:hypothetical protein